MNRAVVLLLSLAGCHLADEQLELSALDVKMSPCSPGDRRVGLRYRIDVADRGREPLMSPGDVSHTIKNCSLHPLWLDTSFYVGPSGDSDAALTQVVRDSAGKVLHPACVFKFRRRAGPSYDVLQPGESRRVVGTSFLCLRPTPDTAYTVRGRFLDARTDPPGPPPGAIWFRGPVESNDLAMRAPSRLPIE